MKEQVIKGQSLTAADWLNLSKRNFRLDLGEVLFLKSFNREVCNNMWLIKLYIFHSNMKCGGSISNTCRTAAHNHWRSCALLSRCAQRAKDGRETGRNLEAALKTWENILTCTLLIAALMNVKTLLRTGSFSSRISGSPAALLKLLVLEEDRETSGLPLTSFSLRDGL